MNLYQHGKFVLLATGLLVLGLSNASAQAPTRLQPAPEVIFAPPASGLAERFGEPVGAGGQAGFGGGVGLYIVQPYFENNPAFNVLSETHSGTKDATGATADRVNVSHHMQAAPLVWLGYVGADGLGARARYWYFRQGSDQSIYLAPFTGDFTVDPDGNVVQTSGTLYTVTSATPQGLQAFGNTLSRDLGRQSTNFNVQTKLEAQVGDLEVSQDFRLGQWDVTASGGLRIVRLVQTYNVYVQDSGGPLEFRNLLSSYDFEGAGPVVAVDLRRRVADSGFHLVGNARGAVVMGSAQQDALFGGLRLRNDDPNPQIAQHHWTRGLPIAELEVGFEYARAVGGGQFFAQLTLVGQQWFGAGNASRSSGLSPTQSLNPVLGGAPVDSDLAFLGLAVRVGWDY